MEERNPAARGSRAATVGRNSTRCTLAAWLGVDIPYLLDQDELGADVSHRPGSGGPAWEYLDSDPDTVEPSPTHRLRFHDANDSMKSATCTTARPGREVQHG